MTIGQFLCGLTGGHDRVLRSAGTTLTLQCIHCGHDTPGWDMGTPRYTRTQTPGRARRSGTNIVEMRRRQRGTTARS